jgi:hypothetical protein
LILEPEVSPAIDIGPCSRRRETSRKRISSSKAAKSRAERIGASTDFELRRGDKVFLDQLHNVQLPNALVPVPLAAHEKRSLHQQRLQDARRYLDLISKQWDTALGRLREFVEE